MNILLIGALGKMAKNVKEIAPNFDVKIIAEIDRNFENITDKKFDDLKICSNKFANLKLEKLTKIKTNKLNKNISKSETKKLNNNILNIELKKKKSCCKNTFKNFDEISTNLIPKIDVVLDFCSPQILEEEIEFCTSHKLPLLICSTGHNDSQKKLIENASKTIPIFYSANTSLSINLIGKFIKKYVDFFKTFNIDIVETHHKSKLDSPSGTAKFFAQNLSPLSPTIHSIRAGEIVGEHQIIFTSPYEKIVLSHTAFDRKLFAEGALKICKFLHKKTSPKLYTMDDIFDTYFLLAPQNGQI